MDKAEGVWVGYFYDGTIDKEYTETYKDGVKISDWIRILKHTSLPKKHRTCLAVAWTVAIHNANKIIIEVTLGQWLSNYKW